MLKDETTYRSGSGSGTPEDGAGFREGRMLQTFEQREYEDCWEECCNIKNIYLPGGMGVYYLYTEVYCLYTQGLLENATIHVPSWWRCYHDGHLPF